MNIYNKYAKVMALALSLLLILGGCSNLNDAFPNPPGSNPPDEEIPHTWLTYEVTAVPAVGGIVVKRRLQVKVTNSHTETVTAASAILTFNGEATGSTLPFFNANIGTNALLDVPGATAEDEPGTATIYYEIPDVDNFSILRELFNLTGIWSAATSEQLKTLNENSVWKTTATTPSPVKPTL